MSELVQENTRIVPTQTSLSKEQKEAVGLLSVGTFLEYFDLMLYVHMAVLLNELFFPQSDPHTTTLLSAFSFCATFVFRPIGALLFGWIGDKVGRKVTLFVTTFMMACSCLVMFSLPTYAQIGITASVLITICRIVQGMSSLGEAVGAGLYLTEMTKPPMQYPVVGCISIFAGLGGVCALGIATLVTSHGFNWRYAFLFGTVIALVGAMARTRLREAPEFADATRRLLNKLKTFGLEKKDITNQEMLNEKVNIKTILAYLSIESTGPIIFYFVYIHCATMLKSTFNYSAEQIISHNLFVIMAELITSILITYLCYKIYPIKILKIKLVICASIIIFMPYILTAASLTNHPILQEKVSKKTVIALFLFQCAGPVSFYFIYIYCGNVLKTNFGYTMAEVIQHNFIACIIEFLTISILCYLSLKIYPLLILRVILIICSIFIIFCPYLLNNISSPCQLFLMQFVMILLYECLAPALPICYKNFPVFKRFTYVSVIFAISRTSMYVITAFAFTYLYDHFGHWGLWIIMVPTIISFAYGLLHFEKLAKEYGDLPIAFRDTATYSEKNNYSSQL